MRLSEIDLTVLHEGEFDDLGLLGTTGLGYLIDAKYAPRVKGPVITTLAIAREVSLTHGVVVAEDPESAFWALHVRLMADGFFPNTGLYIEGGDCRIHPTAVIGKDGFEHHNSQAIPHAGWVSIGRGVTIGAHTCVDRSLWKEPTSIGDDTHIDNLVHVAHNVAIGRRCRVVAGTVIGGSVRIGDDCFIGIGARIRPAVSIGDGAFIGMSVTVLEDVPPGARLTCRSS